MSTEFKIDSAKITKISSAFGVDEKTVQMLHQSYQQFSPYLQGQFLAHVMRGIECYFRKALKNDRFIVICEPYKNFVKGQKQASADYYQGNKFVIYYNKDIQLEKVLRDYIAHEIGHLFWLATIDAMKKDKRKNMYTGSMEPLSSIFGVFAMSEKDDFYATYDVSARNHKDWQEILTSFVNIQTK
jgi:Zn-dependent peptidase ImmA (M78 family)